MLGKLLNKINKVNFFVTLIKLQPNYFTLPRGVSMLLPHNKTKMFPGLNSS